MELDVGDKVVYPHHGAAIVERREKKEARMLMRARHILVPEPTFAIGVSEEEADKQLDALP